jgi:hypothetical protein
VSHVSTSPEQLTLGRRGLLRRGVVNTLVAALFATLAFAVSMPTWARVTLLVFALLELGIGCLMLWIRGRMHAASRE